MQPLELVSMALFQLGFAIGTLEMLFAPDYYRNKEIRFFTNPRSVSKIDLFLFMLAIASFVFLVAHLFYEEINIANMLTYLMIIIYTIMIPLFFISRSYVASLATQAEKKKTKEYVADAIARLILLAAMIGLPYFIRP